MHKCNLCKREFRTFQARVSHEWRAHTEEGKIHNTRTGYVKGTFVPWNKGLTKEVDERVKQSSKKVGDALRGKKRPSSPKNREIFSKSMKKLHAEGRAWNIGKSRWKNKPSYPEIFFMQVIKNEFIDKEYKREVPLGKYSIDFAWLHKKRAIEIDGEQHDTNVLQKKRDIAKNELFIKEGWKFIRIKWKDMYNDSKKWISVAKEFIDNA